MTLALYRKYRPRSFAEMIGQEHVTEPLSQALRTGRLNHAYLFSGPRGCGKTSSARILARSLNCEKGPTPDPCGECDSCRALAPDGPGSIDVIEIDAASHGGVDDARDLRERAFFAPVSSRFKVYIIDEAHMVSSAGFNALLKLVEEPPEYVKFVFATTEPEKVLGTIKSRTHHYPFRLFPPSVVRPYIEKLSAAEGVKIEPPVFPLVVRAGGGSMRDTLSVLDQLIGGAGPEGVTYARAVALLGVTDVALIDEVCDALAAGDGAAVYTTIDRVAEAGHDARRFAGDLLERLRNLIVLQQVPDAIAKGLLDGSDDELERMAEQAQRFGSATLSRMADIVHTGLIDMRGTTAPRLVLELISARMLLPGAEDSSNALLARMERLERRFTLSGGDDAAGHAPAGVDPPPRSVGRTGDASTSAGAGAGAADAGSAPAVSGGGTVAGGAPAVSGATAGGDLTAAGGAPAAGGARRGTDRPPIGPAVGDAASGSSAAAVIPAGPGLAATDATVGGPDGSAASSDPAAVANAAAAIGEARQPGAATAPAVAMTNAAGPDASTNAGAANTGASNAVTASPDMVTPDPSATMAARTDVPAQPDGDRSPGAPGAIDAAAIRRIWGEVLTMVRQKSRKEAAYALDANVRDVVGNTLVLLFKYPLHAEAIATSPTNLQDALYEILGIRFQIRCDVAGQASGPATRPVVPAATSSVAANRPSAPADAEPAPTADDDWPTTATLGGSGADGGVAAPPASAPAVPASAQTGASAQAGKTTQAGAPAQAGASARAGAPTRPGAPARQATPARTGASTRSAPSSAPDGSGRTAARAAAAGRGNAPGRTGSSATKPGADEAWAGSAGEEPPYDPEFDPPPTAADHIGFDPGDEPVDDDAPGAADRPTSEQQAIDLLRDALGAEKIG